MVWRVEGLCGTQHKSWYMMLRKLDHKSYCNEITLNNIWLHYVQTTPKKFRYSEILHPEGQNPKDSFLHCSLYVYSSCFQIIVQVLHYLLMKLLLNLKQSMYLESLILGRGEGGFPHVSYFNLKYKWNACIFWQSAKITPLFRFKSFPKYVRISCFKKTRG